MFVYYQLVENHILKDCNLKRLDLKQINLEELTLIKHGKLPSHIFMLSVMLLKDKCLPIKLKKKVLQQLSIFLVKEVMSTMMLFQVLFTLIQKLPMLDFQKNNLKNRVLLTMLVLSHLWRIAEQDVMMMLKVWSKS